MNRRQTRARPSLIFLCAAAAASAAPALSVRAPQQAAPVPSEGSRPRPRPPVEVEVRVEAVSADSVYIDAGRDSQIEVGDRLWLQVAGGIPVAATIRAVAQSSARAELERAGTPVDVGTVGRLELPRSRFEAVTPAARVAGESSAAAPLATSAQQAGPPSAGPLVAPPPARPPAEHPEWTYGPLEWDEEVPLLAPASERTPEERPTRAHGHFYLSGEEQRGDIGSDRLYRSWRAGADVGVENPFAHGGALEMDLEYDGRHIETEDEGSIDDSTLRVDELSYHVGGIRGRPWRFQAGRFRNHEMSEFGRLDGVEIGRRLPNGDRASLSLGLLPERDDELADKGDAGITGAYRWMIGEEERSSFALGAQHTWSNGAQDRELVIASLDASLGRRTSLFGRAWVDHYGGDAQVKSQGFELTQAQLNVLHRFEAGHNISLFMSHYRWPEIGRFDGISESLLRDGYFDRAGLSGRYKISHSVRLTGRVDQWRDQDDDGGGHELGVELVDLLWPHGRLSLSRFETQGSFTDGSGYRVRADAELGFARASLAYNTARYEPVASIEDSATTDRDSIRASLDFELTRDIDLALFAEKQREDAGGSSMLGFELRWGL